MFHNPDFSRKYARQSVREFKTWIKKHSTSFRKNNNTFEFAQHSQGNWCGTGSIDNIRDILFTNKENNMDNIGKYYIFGETNNGTEISDNSS